jgi:predicted metal-binding membrane protein
MSASASASTAQRRAAPLSTTVQVGLVAGLLAIAAGCWLLTGDRMVGMDAGPGTALGGLGWFLVSWLVMMAAMMLPATAPMVVAHAGLQPAARGRATLSFVAGYLTAWSAAGLVAYALVEGVRSLDLGFLAWDAAGRYIAGGAILAAALFQLTPTKDACLRRCRDPRAARSGLEHGVNCIACCWALMVALFALGVMSIGWMAVVAALIVAERLLPARLMARQAVAVVLVVLGLGVAFAPGQVPGLTLPASDDGAGMTMMMQQ